MRLPVLFRNRAGVLLVTDRDSLALLFAEECEQIADQLLAEIDAIARTDHVPELRNLDDRVWSVVPLKPIGSA